MKVEVNCCEGDGGRNCLGDRCPLYNSAKISLKRDIPWVPTGFGGLYGDPSHQTILNVVKQNIKEQKKSKRP